MHAHTHAHAHTPTHAHTHAHRHSCTWCSSIAAKLQGLAGGGVRYAPLSKDDGPTYSSKYGVKIRGESKDLVDGLLEEL